MVKKEISTPQFYDRVMQRSAIALFILSLNYVGDIARLYVSSEVAQLFVYASKVSAVVVLLLILPSLIPLVRRRMKNKGTCREPEGFIVEGFKKATMKAFAVTFLVLVYSQMFAENIMAAVSAETVVNFVLALLLGTVSISFFFYVREDSEEEDDDFSVEPEV